jgi:hypothetical protein
MFHPLQSVKKELRHGWSGMEHGFFRILSKWG